MESNTCSEDYQDHLANHIIKQGYTIYGGYVYKKIVNGDKTDDIDVHVKDKEDMNILAKHLQETFGCNKEKSYWESDCYDIPLYEIGMRMLCPYNKQGLYAIDLMDTTESQQTTDIFKLEYKQVNDKPQIVYKEGTDEQAKKVIKELKQRRFSPWGDMRDKDKLYFSKENTWTNTSTYNFKIKKLIGLVE